MIVGGWGGDGACWNRSTCGIDRVLTCRYFEQTGSIDRFGVVSMPWGEKGSLQPAPKPKRACSNNGPAAGHWPRKRPKPQNEPYATAAASLLGTFLALRFFPCSSLFPELDRKSVFLFFLLFSPVPSPPARSSLLYTHSPTGNQRLSLSTRSLNSSNVILVVTLPGRHPTNHPSLPSPKGGSRNRK